jgi:hypothetical protein
MRSAIAALVVATACGGSGPSAEPLEFYGILIDAPAGSSTSSSGTHTPSHHEGASTEVTPGIVFIRPDTTDYYVEIQKLPGVVSLEGMKYVYERQPQASDLRGRVTDRGWDLEYTWKNEGHPPGTVHVRYLQLDGEQYQCQYDSTNTMKLEVAEALCRSMRPIKKSAK